MEHVLALPELVPAEDLRLATVPENGAPNAKAGVPLAVSKISSFANCAHCVARRTGALPHCEPFLIASPSLLRALPYCEPFLIASPSLLGALPYCEPFLILSPLLLRARRIDAR